MNPVQLFAQFDFTSGCPVFGVLSLRGGKLLRHDVIVDLLDLRVRQFGRAERWHLDQALANDRMEVIVIQVLATDKRRHRRTFLA